jgi:hypothetical protein
MVVSVAVKVPAAGSAAQRILNFHPYSAADAISPLLATMILSGIPPGAGRTIVSFCAAFAATQVLTGYPTIVAVVVPATTVISFLLR